MRRGLVSVLATLFFSFWAYGSEVDVVPVPDSVKIAKGAFDLTGDTLIVAGKGLGKYGEYLQEMLAPATGFSLKVADRAGRGSSVISLKIKGCRRNSNREAYELVVKQDRIDITASTEVGIFYGIQTLRQLLPVEIESDKKAGVKAWDIPCVEIRDEPRFGWRGLMIDCSRTFWSKDYIKRTIELLSLYKLNKLHLHLTDNQGWRLEIKKYPILTELGSKFPEKYNEPPERHGYYSQADMREIIEYGKFHNVEIIPEFDIPGHTLAFVTCFPELSCKGGPYEIYPWGRGPNRHEDILCAGNEKVFKVLDDIFSEVAELFPSKYIHIGGDEAPKNRWKECPKCQNRIKDEGLKDELELQSYFVKRVEKMLNEKGKTLIGWDEILEGGLAPNAAVMSWRGTKGGIHAAKEGHYVIMSPTGYCYFDFPYEPDPNLSKYYKPTDTLKVYSLEPIPDELTEDQRKYILGAQANFWSHLARTEEKIDRQIYPRLLSLAEVTWSPKDKRDEVSFKKRMQQQLKRLAALGVNCYDDPSLAEGGSK